MFLNYGSVYWQQHKSSETTADSDSEEDEHESYGANCRALAPPTTETHEDAEKDAAAEKHKSKEENHSATENHESTTVHHEDAKGHYEDADNTTTRKTMKTKMTHKTLEEPKWTIQQMRIMKLERTTQVNTTEPKLQWTTATPQTATTCQMANTRTTQVNTTESKLQWTTARAQTTTTCQMLKPGQPK